MLEMFVILVPALWLFALAAVIADLIEWLQKKKAPRRMAIPQRRNENMFK